jgi:hypothetical protein
MNSEPVKIQGSRHHIRNHVRNLHRGLPHKKLHYQRERVKSNEYFGSLCFYRSNA